MQSVSNPAVYSAGDAEDSGRRIEYPPVPSVVFTLPPLASVGLQEAEARGQGLRGAARTPATASRMVRALESRNLSQ